MSAPPQVALAECCEVVGGGTPRTSDPDAWGGDIAWATPKDLSDSGERYIGTTRRNITTEGLRRSGARVLPPGSVLLSSRAPIGLVAINTVPMATNQGFKSLIPDTERADARYLAHWLGANTARLQELGNGATFKEVSKSIVSKVKVPLPSLAEQRRVAQVLDAADGLSLKRQEASRQLEELGQSVFAEMFASGVENGWPRVKLSDLAAPEAGSIRTGPFGSQLLHREFVDEGVPVLGIDNVVANEFRWAKPRHITESKYRKLERYTVRTGDVLITIMGTCGRAAVVPPGIPPAINTKHLCAITLDQALCLPEFLHAYFLRHPLAASYLTGAAKGAIMSGLNMRIVKEMPVTLPPLETQRHYVALAASVESRRRSAVRQHEDLGHLFASLQSRAFSGEL